MSRQRSSSVSWKNADANKPLITAINVDRTSFETDAELDIPETALTPGTGQGGLKKAGSFTIRTRTGRRSGCHGRPHTRDKIRREHGARDANPLHHSNKKLRKTTTTII